MSAVRKMNPQWKNFQPPAQDPAILSYQRSPTVNSVITTTNSNFIRETGFIEKLLHSYGFIQCCERDARLFFHFSEYNGDMNTLKIGDAVEFEMSSDKRTGRPIASSVVRMDSDHVSFEVLSDERFKGLIVQEAKPSKSKNGLQTSNQDDLGRVTYEHSGEFFFLPYSTDDIHGHGKFKSGDQVTFFIATDKRNGNIQARKLESTQVLPVIENKNQGVVCSMKEKFGFIERSDVVKEIFFHFSEFKGNINELILGDDVEFDIQTRNGKEVAGNVAKLPEGTVIFEDVALERIKGTIIKTLKNKRQGDPLGGRITYESPKGPIEIPYGDKDQRGDCTLLSGDIVEFNSATDRRDKLKRATSILLLENSFEKSGERREPGTVVSLKEGYGFIQCAEREARMFFHFSEGIDGSRDFALQDGVEFTVTQDPSRPSRQIAIRIKWLNKGTIPVLVVRTEKYIGTIDREPALYKSPAKTKDGECGTIVFDYEGAIQLISYQFRDLLDIKCPPRYGDKVEFSIGEMKGNSSKQAINVKVVIRNIAGRCRGFVATLKDNYGFIENADHEKEVFFHFSSFDGDPSDLDIGDELEYTITRKSAKLSAENIHKLPKGSIPTEEILKEKGQLQGKVLRPMRIVNPDQEEYCGLVLADSTDDSELQQYPYGVTSLADKRDFLQKGDIVKFNLAVAKGTDNVRAVNLAAVRKYIRARVSSVKGQFGFLNYEAEEGKKLFFHMTEVHDGVEVQPGNEVEFVVVQNQLNKKFSACSLRKITDTQRPERLVSRLKSINDETGVRVLVIRQPKGPDGTKGFSRPRPPWNRST